MSGPSAEKDAGEVQYRAPWSRGRWEPSPFGAAESLLLFGANYDLRIDGEIRRATPPGASDALAECDGCLCPTEHDGDYGSSGHVGPCPPHTCVTSPVEGDT